jgi:hypothetical protein
LAKEPKFAEVGNPDNMPIDSKPREVALDFVHERKKSGVARRGKVLLERLVDVLRYARGRCRVAAAP